MVEEEEEEEALGSDLLPEVFNDEADWTPTGHSEVPVLPDTPVRQHH